MSTSKVIAGGWYGDSLPDGRYATLVINQHIETHLGNIAFSHPKLQPLFLRVGRDPVTDVFKLAGQASGSPDPDAVISDTLEYIPDIGWKLLPPAGGVSPVIYRDDGSLYTKPFVYPDGSISSQGWRFEGLGRLWNGDETYGPTPQAPKLYGWTILSQDGYTLVIGQGWEGGVVIWDGSVHRRLDTGACLAVRARNWSGQCSVSYYRDLPGGATETKHHWLTAAELLALPIIEDVPDLPIGPLSDPLPEGTPVNVADFFAHDDRFWPRGNKAQGDTHGMDFQPVTHKGAPCLWEAKFDVVGKGRLGELLQIDAPEDGFIHLLADCSNEQLIDIWTDTRWLRKQMRIGRQYGLVDNASLLHKHKRSDGSIVSSQGWTEENWVHRVWPKYWCGSDLGERTVLQYVYNNTGVRSGQTTNNPELYVETYFMALGAGWIGWSADQAMKVFAGGNVTLPSVPPTQFARLGWKRYPPDIPAFIPLATTEEPPVPPPTPTTGVMLPGYILKPDVPFRSHDGRFTLLYQSDGNLVLYGPSGPLWASGTAGQSVGFVALQGDGNWVIYGADGKPRWASGTNGKPVAQLIVQNDGNVVLYSATTALWATWSVYMPPPPPEPPPPGSLVLPVLSIAGRQFMDLGKLWIPRFVSGLTLLVRTPAEQSASLDRSVANGANGVRVFCGALTWANQTPEAARAALPALLDRCAARGLAVEATCLTDTGTGYDCEAHLDAIGAIVSGRKYVLAECWNEFGHGSQRQDITVETTIKWGKKYFGARGILWAVGAAGVDEPSPDGIYPTAGGDYSTAHLDRGRQRWDNVRRVREIYAIADVTGAPALDNEPMGADELDGSVTGKQRWNDPALFLALGALDRLFGVGGVHHSQAGLYAVLPGPVQQQCAVAYVQGQAAVERALPGLVGAYKNVGHAGGPLVDVPYGDQPGAKATRLYASVSGNRGALVILGNAGTGLKWANGWSSAGVLASMTGQDGLTVDVLSLTQ